MRISLLPPNTITNNLRTKMCCVWTLEPKETRIFNLLTLTFKIMAYDYERFTFVCLIYFLI